MSINRLLNRILFYDEYKINPIHAAKCIQTACLKYYLKYFSSFTKFTFLPPCGFIIRRFFVTYFRLPHISHVLLLCKNITTGKLCKKSEGVHFKQGFAQGVGYGPRVHILQQFRVTGRVCRKTVFLNEIQKVYCIYKLYTLLHICITVMSQFLLKLAKIMQFTKNNMF